jgi:3-dehydroquinate synthase
MNIHKIEGAGNYPIYVGFDSLHKLNDLLNEGKQYSKLVVLVDENTHRACLPLLVAQVEKIATAEILEIESGEQQKNITICTQLWESLGAAGLDRKSLLINLGGGVIGDMGGFVAATYKRGIDFINIPTTLLAQVDSSVGGKLGIDLNQLKNEIGVFGYPQAVFIYSSFLSTLPEQQLLSGYAELIKHVLIADEAYWPTLLHIGKPQLELIDLDELIAYSVEIKNRIVLQDPYEMGLRKVLNFGHTIGHAIESYSLINDPQPLLHGEAIVIGMIAELYLSHLKLDLPIDTVNEIRDYLFSLYGKKNIEYFPEPALIKLMQHDKKNENRTINFTLLKAIGEAEINHNCSAEEIAMALKYYNLSSY